MEVAGKSLPVLTNLDKGRYGVLIFENLNKYLQMDKWNRELLDKYCREYSVGIVGFTPLGEESLVGAQLKGFPLFVHTNLRLKVRCLLFGRFRNNYCAALLALDSCRPRAFGGSVALNAVAPGSMDVVECFCR